MITNANSHDLSRFCSVCARQAGLDPIGQAQAYDQIVAAELPLPWPITMYDQPGVLPDELLRFRQLLIEQYQQGQPIRTLTLAIAPDPIYSQAGLRRVLSYTRPAAPFAVFSCNEYLVPDAEVGPLCWALLVERALLPRFEGMRLPPSPTRDLLVCTHGSVDAACAKFGMPTYRLLRNLAADMTDRLRVWRVSHFGGHVFAPTLLDLPHGSYWAWIDTAQAAQIAQQQGEVARLRDHYRGWSGLESPFLQALERELFVQHGWPWLTYLKAGVVLAEGTHSQSSVDAAGAWADVQLAYAVPDGSAKGVYTARVTETRRVTTPHSTGSLETYSYPQYVVSRLTPAPLDSNGVQTLPL